MQTDLERVDATPANDAQYSKENMLAGLAAITRSPEHVRINMARLDEVAKQLPRSVASSGRKGR